MSAETEGELRRRLADAQRRIDELETTLPCDHEVAVIQAMRYMVLDTHPGEPERDALEVVGTMALKLMEREAEIGELRDDLARERFARRAVDEALNKALAIHHEEPPSPML